MSTLHKPMYYLHDQKLEPMYVSCAQQYYGFTPSKTFRQLHRETCLKRLETFIGQNITHPEHKVTRTAVWDTYYGVSKGEPPVRRMAIDMTVEWGGSWGFYGAASRGVVDRLIKAFMARYPQATLVAVDYYYHQRRQDYYPKYWAVDFVEIAYTVTDTA